MARLGPSPLGRLPLAAGAVQPIESDAESLALGGTDTGSQEAMINHHSRPGSWRLSLAVALLTVLTLVSALAGCGGDDTETGTEDEASATDQSGGGSGGSDDETPPDDTAATGQSTNELAEGSGCTPGTETGLPDGRWFGFIGAIDGRRVDFDLACRFTDDAAVAAAAEDGEDNPPPNNYYVRNVNPRIRTLTVADGTMIEWYPDFAAQSAETVTFDEWVAAGVDLQLESRGFWIETSNGLITAIEEQWVP